MKRTLQSAAMLCAVSLAGWSVLNFPVGAKANDSTRLLALAPPVTVTPLQVYDRLGPGRIVQE